MSLTTTTLAADFSGLADLKREARANTPAANREVARQFEALMLQTMLKSMRAATPREGLFDSEETRLYESMHDEQLAQLVAGSGRGLGLAALLEKQLARLQGGPAEGVDPPEGLSLQSQAKSFSLEPAANSLPLIPPEAASTTWPLGSARLGSRAAMDAAAARMIATGPNRGRKDAASAGAASMPAEPAAAHPFVRQILPHAAEASRQLGVPAHFMIAQAALETGWGRHEPRHANGQPSHNLFGIKAGADWQGPVVTATTVEVVQGQEQRQTARFRAYGSYREAFQDYARLLTEAPRYAGVRAARDAQGFARGLQQAGYATDPAYADKLVQIIQGDTLRAGLAASLA